MNGPLVVLDEGGYQVKILHDTTLEKMINDQIIQGICNGFGTVQTLKKFTESKELLHPNDEITILLQVHPGKYDDNLHLQLQFVSSESETKVNFSPMSPKLVRTYRHIVGNLGNYNGTIIFEIDVMKKSSPSN